MRNQHNEGFVLAITGPSGAGKTTLCRELVATGHGVPSTTVTTRPPRPGEENSLQYEYVTMTKFQDLLDHNELLCQTEFCDNRYGIRKAMVSERTKDGNVLVLDTIISPLTLKGILGERVAIVFLTPTAVELLSRLRARPDLTTEELTVRLEEASTQYSRVQHCDYVVFTKAKVEDTAFELRGLVNSLGESWRRNEGLFPQTCKCFTVQNVIRKGWVPGNDLLLLLQGMRIS